MIRSLFHSYDGLEEYVRRCVKEERFIEAIVLVHTSIEIYLSSIIADTLDNSEKIKVIKNHRFIDLGRFVTFLTQLTVLHTLNFEI